MKKLYFRCKHFKNSIEMTIRLLLLKLNIVQSITVFLKKWGIHAVNSFWSSSTIHSFSLYIELSLTAFLQYTGLRVRHLLTRKGKIRMRYVTLGGLFILFCLISLTFPINYSNAIAYNNVAESISQTQPSYGIENSSIVEDSYIVDRKNLIQARIFPKILPLEKKLPLKRNVTFKPGDVLSLLMEEQGIGNSVTTEIIASMKEHLDPRYIKAGQEFHLEFEEKKINGEEEQSLKEVRIPLSPIKTLVVARADNGFSANIDQKKVNKKLRAKKATVKISLYGSAAKAGIPDTIIANAIKLYSWNVDFQRDIRSDDTIEIFYESFETDDGHVADNGNILYANLTLSGRETKIYRYELPDGRIDYFQPDGISMRRTLMKTPVNGARVSSGYGMRRHPVLGYSKMHKGIDFAAPTGTPIFAAGDGVIEKAGWFSSYGKYIRIRHNSKLKTAYAHLHKIKSNIKVGARVKQGDVIGTVGSTGRSTGPHLHYEILVNGKQTNPRSVNLPVGEELTGQTKNTFKGHAERIDKQFITQLKQDKKQMQLALKER